MPELRQVSREGHRVHLANVAQLVLPCLHPAAANRTGCMWNHNEAWLWHQLCLQSCYGNKLTPDEQATMHTTHTQAHTHTHTHTQHTQHTHKTHTQAHTRTHNTHTLTQNSHNTPVYPCSVYPQQGSKVASTRNPTPHYSLLTLCHESSFPATSHTKSGWQIVRTRREERGSYFTNKYDESQTFG